MSISIGAAASGGAYTLPTKPFGRPQTADPALSAQQAAKTQAKVAVAQQELANANGIVDQDRRNHSPSCVACDQKLVDKAQAQLAQAKASDNGQTSQAPLPPGSLVDLNA
ncbi:hypothetical protein [Methylobacterium sp. 1973]|uniref:hypothetical protein n=1 Tax=Methylobacterium sp. 1973 TaxID=3156421 RepID=UPI003398FBBD